jgi:hypothetical protein
MMNRTVNFITTGKGKVKLSPYRPWRPLGLREVEAPTFSDIPSPQGTSITAYEQNKKRLPL